MEFETVKEKLHDYIEHGNQSKIMAIYMLLNEEIESQNFVYDEATLKMLENRRDNMISGKDKSYTLKQTIENLKQTRKPLFS